RMDYIINKLAFLQIHVTPNDLIKPEPERVQQLYRSFLIKGFGIAEASLMQPEMSWITPEMQKDPDLYSNAQCKFILLRFIQSILSDFTNMTDDMPQFGIGALIDPKPRETRQFIMQLLEIHTIKQMTLPYCDEEENRLNEEMRAANKMENDANEMENRLERMKGEKNSRIRMEHQLRETQEKRVNRLFEVTKEAKEMEDNLEAMDADFNKRSADVVSKKDDLSALSRKSRELDYGLIDDPEELRREVENLRTRKVDQQRLQDSETKKCRELESREDHCRQAEKTMATIEGEMGLATRTVKKLDDAMTEMYEKEAVLEERKDLLQSKREGVAKKRSERESFKQRHEEEREEQQRRLESLALRISETRLECEKLTKLEGEVKKNVVESRIKLNKLKNEKNAVVQELVEYNEKRVKLLEQIETKMAEKAASLRALEAAYNEGRANLKDAMNTTDLDVSVTATQTMQLLD
ncbi:hypothetical protein PFISCL1PPCAC_160, partial [Pristionchus fissidentatus]